MPIDLSFIGRGIQPLDTSGGEPIAPENDDVARVQQILQALGPLMGSMESAPPPARPVLPPMRSGGSQIMGGIGDALLAAAAARLGHAPGPGPFATEMARTEQERMALQNRYQESAAAQAAADRAERNRVRAAAGIVGLRAGERPPKSLIYHSQSGVENGQPVEQPIAFDPSEGTVRKIGAPIPQYVKPSESKPERYSLKDTPTGPMWFDSTDPKAPGIPARGPTGEPVPPKPSEKVVETLSTLDDLKQSYADMKKLFRAGHGYDVQGGKIVRSQGEPQDVLVHGAGGAGALVHPSKESRWEQILAGWATRPGFLRGALSGLIPGAATHEELRAKIIPQLLRPLSGQSRAMASLLEQFQHFLPDWTVAPEAAEPAFATADAMIERADKYLRTAFPGQAPSDKPSLDDIRKAVQGVK